MLIIEGHKVDIILLLSMLEIFHNSCFKKLVTMKADWSCILEDREVVSGKGREWEAP